MVGLLERVKEYKKYITVGMIVALVSVLHGNSVTVPSVQAAEKTYEGVISYTLQDRSCIITDCSKKASGTLVIPEKIDGAVVAKVEKGAFDDCNKLDTIVFMHAPILPKGSFAGCTKLETVVLNLVPENECDYYYEYDFTKAETQGVFAKDSKYTVYIVKNDNLPKSMYLYWDYMGKAAEIAAANGLSVKTVENLSETPAELDAKVNTKASTDQKKQDTTQKPEQVVLLSAESNKSGQATLIWKPQSKVTGYEIYAALSKNTSAYKVGTVKKAAAISYQAVKLVPGTQYYFKVRVYKISGKKTYYGEFSEVIKVMVKGDETGWNGVYSDGSKKVIIINNGEKICVVDKNGMPFFITPMQGEIKDNEINTGASDSMSDYTASYTLTLKGDKLHFLHTYSKDETVITDKDFTKTKEDPYTLYTKYKNK